MYEQQRLWQQCDLFAFSYAHKTYQPQGKIHAHDAPLHEMPMRDIYYRIYGYHYLSFKVADFFAFNATRVRREVSY
jgi:hypothetical protein